MKRSSDPAVMLTWQPQHETPGPPPALTSPEAAKAAEALGDLGLPLTFDVERRMPIRPPEWAEEERKRRERQVAAQGGVKIRRRPPSGPPSHAVGPFEFKIESDDNKPMNILEEIVWHKDFELVRMKESMSLPAVMKGLPSAPPVRDFVGELRKRLGETGVPALIAEVKKASPSRGVIQPDFDPVMNHVHPFSPPFSLFFFSPSLPRFILERVCLYGILKVKSNL